MYLILHKISINFLFKGVCLIQYFGISGVIRGLIIFMKQGKYLIKIEYRKVCAESSYFRESLWLGGPVP